MKMISTAVRTFFFQGAHVGLTAFGQQYALYSGFLGGKEFVAQAAYGQYASAQGQFAAHGNVAPGRAAGHQ